MALDKPEIDFPEDVEKAMAGHVIGTAELIGLYQKQSK